MWVLSYFQTAIVIGKSDGQPGDGMPCTLFRQAKRVHQDLPLKNGQSRFARMIVQPPAFRNMMLLNHMPVMQQVRYCERPDIVQNHVLNPIVLKPEWGTLSNLFQYHPKRFYYRFLRGIPSRHLENQYSVTGHP